MGKMTRSRKLVIAAGGPGQEQAHLGRGLQGQPPVLKVAPQAVPSVGSVAELVRGGHLRGESPLNQIFLGGLAAVALQSGSVKGQGFFMQIVEDLALLSPAGLLGAQVPGSESDTIASGQLRGRLGKGEAVILHDKGDDAAPGTATEAVENAFVRRDGEGGLGIGVEGTEAHQVFAPALQLDVLPHHLFQGGGLFDLQKLVFRDVRGQKHLLPT